MADIIVPNGEGEFIPSKIGKNAPLIFIAGGMSINLNGVKTLPGDYMKTLGFGDLSNFNIYNIKRTWFKDYADIDRNILAAWENCKKIMEAQGVNPSKKILVGFSLGAAHIEPLVRKEGAGYWDLVVSAGAYLKSKGAGYNDHVYMINALTEYENKTKPIKSRFVYVHAAKIKDEDINGDSQLISIQKLFENRLPSGNSYGHKSAKHRKTVTAAADWIKNYVIVNNDGSANITIPTTQAESRQKLQTKKNNVTTTRKIEEPISDIPADKLKTYIVSWPAQNRGRGKIIFKTTEEEAAKIKNEKLIWFLRTTGPSVNIDIDKIDPITLTDENRSNYFGWYGFAGSTPKKKEVKDEIIDSKIEDGKPNGAETGASEQCTIEEKNNATFKSQSDPEGCGDINTDAEPPSKTEKGINRLNKYNHRFYIKPSLTLRDAAFENPSSNPAELTKMVEKTGPWYNRYWAYRPNSGPNYGFEKYESTISDNGVNLISGVIPYWRPPFDDKNPKDDALVKGDWNKLIEDYEKINSPIDIPITLNAYEVGVFNDKIGYIYESENELHMTLLESEIINKGKLAIGQGINDSDAFKKVPDSSWANYPRWSGIFTEHCLKNSGFTLQEKLSSNIDFYHRSILSRDRLVNHPGNKKMSWKEMKKLAVKDGIFKPSKIWLDPKYLKLEEYFENDDNSSIAIFIIGYHINTDGTLTDHGKRLVNHINKGLRWTMATISAVPNHLSNSTLCYTDVLLYMDENGTVVTLGGNTDIPNADSSVISGNHISVKVTNFARFAKITVNSGVNGSIIVARTKSNPPEETFRNGFGLDTKLIATRDGIFDKYRVLVESTTSREKISDEYYKKLMPYIVFSDECYAGGITTADGGIVPEKPTDEPEYLPNNYEKPLNMDPVNTDNCEQLRKKYNLSADDTNIPGISAQGVATEINNKDCKGGLTPIQVANLMATLAGSESSNRYNVKGGGGGNFSGRYQFGYGALVDTGYVKKGGSINNPASWTGKNGIRSRQDFLNCPIVQELAMQEYLKINLRYLYLAGSKISKKILDEMPCNEIAGLLAISHLVGFGAAQKFFKSGGKTNNKDAFGMDAATYYKLGFGAASGIFLNQKLGRHGANTGENYFLYPGAAKNGLGLNADAGNGENEIPEDEPPFVLQANEGLAKFSPATVKFITITKQGSKADLSSGEKILTGISSESGLARYKPEEYIRISGTKNGAHCSWFEAKADDNPFGVTYIPPFKGTHLPSGDSIEYLTKDGIPAYKRVPESKNVRYLVWIDTNNEFHISFNMSGTDKTTLLNNVFPPIPANAKYLFSTKYLATFKFSDGRKINLAPSTDQTKHRCIIGKMDDGNMFIFAVGYGCSWKHAADRVLKIPGVKYSAFMDSGGSTQLYSNGQWAVRPDGRRFPNYMIWE